VSEYVNNKWEWENASDVQPLYLQMYDTISVFARDTIRQGYVGVSE